MLAEIVERCAAMAVGKCSKQTSINYPGREVLERQRFVASAKWTIRSISCSNGFAASCAGAPRQCNQAARQKGGVQNNKVAMAVKQARTSNVIKPIGYGSLRRIITGAADTSLSNGVSDDTA